MKNPLRLLAVTTAALVTMALGLRAADPANFKPDGSFKGSTLAGWHVVGDADWSAQNGELIGKAKPGTSGGWLVMDKSFQDVQLYTNYRCAGDCKSGVLFRARKAADGGMTGVYVSLSDGDTNAYSVTLDQAGKETGRDQLVAPSRGGGAAGGGNAARGAAPAGGAAVRGGAAAPPAPAAAAPAAPAARGVQVGSSGRGRPTLKVGDWNETYITVATEGPPAGSQVGPVEVVSTFTGTVPVDEKNAAAYGAIALYVGGTGEVRYRTLPGKI